MSKGFDQIESDENKIDVVSFLKSLNTDDLARVKSINPNAIATIETELKDSVWNFNIQNFSPEKCEFDLQGDNKSIRSHLWHLAFAVDSIYQEIQGGARYRSRYFQNIRSDLISKTINHSYFVKFSARLNEGEFRLRNGSLLDADNLVNLIGNINNLELKPLRKYFNHIEHRRGDFWDAGRLTAIYENWIMREWRVDVSKDKNKAPNESADYGQLKKNWKKRKGNVIKFWLATNPDQTIPPYQDYNNRRPPRCQSLILNSDYLDRKYPDWESWLHKLKEIQNIKNKLAEFETGLREIRSSSGNPYFFNCDAIAKDLGQRTTKDLRAREFQLILDRVKLSDPLMLNEIFSRTKQIRQNHSTDRDIQLARRKLEDAIAESELPADLKTHRHYADQSVFAPGTFLHFACQYYRQRQRARAGRIFIHPEYRFSKKRGYQNTGRFESKEHLLSYCNHKPRQKRYQNLDDVASLLNVHPDFLAKAKGNDELSAWFEKIKGLKSNCAKAADMQKKYRGRLKSAYLDWNGSPGSELSWLAKRAASLYAEIGNAVFENNPARLDDWLKRQEQNPVVALYLLIQLHSIVFSGDRSGFANTCAVCSRDNSYRCVQAEDGSAYAQRLPAIATRLIDGAVMKIARIVCRAIANDKWEQIENYVERGFNIRIPIITESNRFYFEPDLADLKERRTERAEDLSSLEKENRISSDSSGLSPYSGSTLREDGDIDHIIPRSHPKWGTLNDEANLIYTSREDNEIKGNSKYSLSHLSDAYKAKQFDTHDDDAIASWIKETIWDVQSERFTFGPYRSFRNLSFDQRKAFRHALFLVDDPIREKVLEAIDHRVKTFVNGTQRYFAEVLANELYKKAKSLGKGHLISFDYFGVEAADNSRGDGIFSLRRDLVKHYLNNLSEYDKSDTAAQEPYSHLIDAQIAFCKIAFEHQGEGSIRLQMNGMGLWSRPNLGMENHDAKDLKVFDAQFFDTIDVKPENTQEKMLTRRRPEKDFFDHQQMHRDTIYAEHYLPVLVGINDYAGEVRIGFDWKNSFALNDTKPNRRKLYFVLRFSEFGSMTGDLTENDSFQVLNSIMLSTAKLKSSYFYISLKKQQIQEYYVANFNMALPYANPEELKFLRKISYRTERKQIKHLEEAEKIQQTDKYFKVANSSIDLPVKKEWDRLVHEWKITDLSDEKFLKNYFAKKSNSHQSSQHQRSRQDYSLPAKTSEGKFLIKRYSWTGDAVFQVVNESNSNLKPFVLAIDKDSGKLVELLVDAFKSRNVFRLQRDAYEFELNDKLILIQQDKWISVQLDEDLISCLSYKIDNKTRPKICVEIYDKSPETIKKIISLILKNALLRPRYETENEQERIASDLERQGRVEYQGNSMNEEIKQKVVQAIYKFDCGKN